LYLYGWNLVPIKLVFAANLLVAKQTFLCQFCSQTNWVASANWRAKNWRSGHLNGFSVIWNLFCFFIFPKIYDRFQILQKYTTTAIPHGVWAQQPYHTAAGGAIVFQTPCGVPFMNSTRAVVL
jgi:hypothetical protein